MHTRPKYDEKYKNKVILLMITDGKKWHYLAVKSSPALFRGRTSNHKEEFYWLHCFHSYSTKKKQKKYKGAAHNIYNRRYKTPKKNSYSIS